jgi:fluoride exporter
MVRYLLVCVGGGIGAGARYAVSGLALRLFGAGFPWGTLAVNVVGSFLIAVTMQVGLASEAISPSLRIFIATGVLGGFTTFSTFSYETLEYLREGAFALGFLNVLASVATCLVAAMLGVMTAGFFVRA